MMVTTNSFKEAVRARVQREPKFRRALLQEAVQSFLDGDVETGKAVLRDYIKATGGFEELSEATGTRPKSLIRMFGQRGNPRARTVFAVPAHLQQQAGLELRVGAR